MKMSNKIYDITKYLCLIALPAVSVLISTLGRIWNWNIPTENIVLTINAIGLFIGTLIGISSVNYNKSK